MITRIKTDRSGIEPEVAKRRYIRISLRAPKREVTSRSPLNVAFVIDNSGSMSGRKLGLVKEAVINAIGLLREGDSFSVVSFSNHAVLEVPLSYVSSENVRRAKERVSGIEANGGTNLSQGWELGFHTLQEVPRDALRRLLLLTDGEANDGVQDVFTLASMSQKARSMGIITSTLGVGEGFNEELLVEMSRKGGGNFYYVQRDHQIPALMRQEMEECLDVSLRELRVVVTPPPGFVGSMRVLSSFSTQTSNRALQIEVGDMLSEQEIEVFLEVDFPALPLGDQMAFGFRLEAQEGECETTSKQLVFEVGKDGFVSDRIFYQAWQMKSLGALAEASILNRNGDYRGASRLLQDLAQEALLMAAEMPKLREISMKLMEKAVQYQHRQESTILKSQISDSYSVMRSRNRDSSVQRGKPKWSDTF